MKHSKAPWISTFRINKERGVRNSGGFICFLPKPSHYDGQDERYEEELEESKANALLISKAPELLEALKKVVLIINESEGVLGYHLNGNIAEWDEFEEIQEIKSLLKELE